ncbi:small integral membrane protein 12 [Eurytemora carolleeae]|uniref:small integral membrane protein 12 n=1 Tax=Eurytemora carolleeae TaxID=1294199 RepID=UPI000C77C0D2|nr:small integral membrane protein 12 [Eurytemora carolleeae]|eukprot:XP_023322836.1 small integral membrane protein 12-like [Eurytemora affinis]
MEVKQYLFIFCRPLFNLYSRVLNTPISESKMWPIIFNAMRTYAPWIVLPIAGTIGFIGYNFESLVSDRYTPFKESVTQRREERRLDELEKDSEKVESIREHSFVPQTIFEKNVSPSLKKD